MREKLQFVLLILHDIWSSIETNAKSPNFELPNFGRLELRTSRTLLLSPRLELNELEHPKKVELRTRTQVLSNTKSNIS